MENTESTVKETLEQKELFLSKSNLIDLTEIRKWTMFFTVLGFIAIGFMVLGALAMGMIGIMGGTFGGMREASFLGGISLLYLVIALLYFFPVLYLLKFSTHMKNAIEKISQNDLSVAFTNLKSHYKFVGIFTIVLIGIYILVIFGVILFGLSNLL
ncbi:MAG TPA: hypothetical protein P5132_08505 [Bacteroidales bacterium]|nr:hypothetical protein [Bacteroidales bacterium]